MSVFGTKGRATQIATLTTPGIVQPDGLTMFTNPNSGALSANVGIGKAITTYFIGGNNVTTPTFDLVNFTRVEIRYNLFVGGSGGGIVSILAFDTVGGGLSTQQPTFAVWRGATALTSGTSAAVIPLTELSSTAGPYFGTVTIVRPDFPYTATTSTRAHIQWDSTGTYQGVGAATTSGRGYFAYVSSKPPATVRFTSSIGLSDLRGFFNITHYS